MKNPDPSIGTAAPPREISNEANAKPPLARREPVESVIHGDRRVDHYAWLREKQNPEVIGYLEAENAYASAMLKATEPFQ